MRIHLTRGTVIALAIAGSAGLAFAQAQSNPTPPQAGQPAPTQTLTGPAPGQAGDDPSMAKPQSSSGSPPGADNARPAAANPESTVGLAPADQPINNAKPSVAGRKIPSAQEDTALHNPSVYEHDKQPLLTHTFNFTKEQKQAIAGALAGAKASNAQPGFEVRESSVLPPSVELTPVPDSIGQQMPWVKPYKYAKLGNKILLVDPNYPVVVSIIE